VVLVTGAIVGALLAVVPTGAGAATTSSGPTVYVGTLTMAQLELVRAGGVDREDIAARPVTGGRGMAAVEVVLGPDEAAALRGKGVPLAEKRVDGVAASQRMAAQAASGYTVYRSYSEAGGIKDELIQTARDFPGLTKLVQVGRSVQGQPILALKVTKSARSLRDGARPAVLYSAAQHAREWITPEMNRRLMHYYLDGYTTDAAVKKIVDSTELWFLPVANPDGYDFTFLPGNRLWRKNLHDNDGDGVITGLDGVDPNRNFGYRWGYDNEGSSPNTSGQTYRGAGPASEPETRAFDGLMRRVGFEFLVNYHSAAQLLLYGAGWQVNTPTPDDLIMETLAGDDANPAVPGYDPDIAAELYTTNGETDGHVQTRYGTLAFTPEMSTCETASAVDPNDAFDPADCLSGFNFPDSESLIQAEFEKNVPFALSVARSAKDPSNPVSVVGRTAPDFQVDAFTTSYGDPQPVSVTARRDLRDLTLNYSVAGGRTRQADVAEWRGGERYGGEQNRYYAEFRGVIRGVRPGQSVEVWFTGKRSTPTGVSRRTSAHFTYTLAQKTSAQVLIVANEDYEGINPTYPSTVTAPKYAQTYVEALAAKGIRAAIFDVSRQGVPDHLGVLGHFDAVVWYLGDNRLTQDARDATTNFFGQEVPDLAVAIRQQNLTLAVRDYLNEGGKLVHTGETAAYYGQLGSALGGIYYGLNGHPEQECVVTADPFSDCLLLADDFAQYYLGAFGRSAVSTPTSFSGAGPLAGTTAAFGGPATTDNPLDEPGSFTVTSDVLPVAQFPQFASQAAGTYLGSAGGAFDPVEGTWYAGVLHQDDSYARLARTVDLTAVTAAQAPQLQAKLSFDTEEGYDHVIVEAHTAGADDWTTLPEVSGLTSTTVPSECEVGFLLGEHPFLARYLTPGTPCAATGSTGSWNSFTGNSGGWQQTAFDLSAYAGKQVEVSITYLSDPGSGGLGLVVDDTRVVAGGTTLSAEGFETGLGAWAVAAPPAGSPTTGASFRRSQGLFSSAVATADTVLLGFGIEQVADPAARADLLAAALQSVRDAP
jgi:hypothetical protein